MERLPWNMSSYAVYEGGSLSKYVVINFDEWNSTTPYERPTQDVILTVPAGIESVTVQRLTGNGASADEDIEWAGQSWNYTDGRLAMSGEYRSESVPVNDGKANLSIPSTEAVLVLMRGHDSTESTAPTSTISSMPTAYTGAASRTSVGLYFLPLLTLLLI